MPDQSPSQEQYIVTARKWRPQRFADVVGQEHVSRTLRNAVESKRIHHAYIFNGPRGVGKTTTARILAKAVNCENPGTDFEPCNICPSCVEINTGRSLDVIEIDGASNNSVDDIRKLRENAKYPPVKGEYKMYIIDEVHMLSTSAFNALLKTLEEPPRHLLFVFATTEPHKVPATILSRCQRFDFRRMQIDEIAVQLRYIATQEGITIDDESLAIIGKKGDGSMRDSQSIFDQVIAFCGRSVEYARVNEALNLIDTEFYFTLGRAIREHDVATILDIAREVFMRGYDLQECLHGLAEHFRNLLTVLATQSSALIEASKLHREQYIAEATHFTQADVLQYMTIIMNTEQALRFAPQPRLRFEFALVQMAKLDSAVQISELLAELAELKKKLESGASSTEAAFSTSGAKSPNASIVERVSTSETLSHSKSSSLPPPRGQISSTTLSSNELSDRTSEATEFSTTIESHSPKNGESADYILRNSVLGKHSLTEQTVENSGENHLKNVQNVENSGEKSKESVESSGNNVEAKTETREGILSSETLATTFASGADRKTLVRRAITASELQERWYHLLTNSPELDPAVKTYIQQEMVRAVCNDGEIIFQSTMEFVADKLFEKKAHINNILTLAIGEDIRVQIVGGSQDRSSSLFGNTSAFSSPATPEFSTLYSQERSNQGIILNSSNSNKVQNEHLQTPFDNTTSQPTPQNNKLHELDATIIEVFQAVAVPIRV